MSGKRDILIGRSFAIGAAVAYGTCSVLVRVGVGSLAPPLVGAALALLSGSLVLAVVAARSPEDNLRQKRKSVLFLLLSGAASGFAVVSSYSALSLAPVVIVSPLQSTHPLFALLLSHLFLRKLEAVTPRLVLGTVMVFAGIVLVAIGRFA